MQSFRPMPLKKLLQSNANGSQKIELIQNSLLGKNVINAVEVCEASHIIIPSDHEGVIKDVMFQKHPEPGLYFKITWKDIPEWHTLCTHQKDFSGSCPARDRIGKRRWYQNTVMLLVSVDEYLDAIFAKR